MDNTPTTMETFVSTVLILDHTETSAFENYVKDLQVCLHTRYSDYEIIIIDQNRRLFPLSLKEEILKSVSSIRWICLSSPVEVDIALSAGIENAIGDFVVLMRPTIDPICVIEDMVQESAQGYDVIIGIAPRPRTLGYKMVRKVSNKLLHSIDYHIPQNATPVRCLSRRAINTVLRTGNINHQFFIKVANTGYPSKIYNYELLDTTYLQKRTLWSGISQTLKLMVFNSTKPLRWISLLGVLGSLMALLFAIYSIIVNLLKDDVIEGWTSMVFFSSFLFMVLFIILAFLGEYLARLLNEQGQQKSYYISSEETSSAMLEADRFNVLQQS